MSNANGERADRGVSEPQGDHSEPSGPALSWGVATAAYQIEGATRADGRGESIWDRYCATPGKIARGETAERACDHYHRYEHDLDLVQWLGLGAYRFSIGWSRVMPSGAGPANPAGVAFYDRLVDACLARGIAPMVTLNHWDLPQGLGARGGWTRRETVDRFVEYAQVVYRTLGDRVSQWITHNEPWCIAFLGYLRGVHAPGATGDLYNALRAAHHLLLSHGLAVQALRAHGNRGQIGITLNLAPHHPYGAGDEPVTRLCDGYLNRWFLDPVYRGTYPADTAEHFARLAGPLDFVHPGDAAVIQTPTDFLGVNYYGRRVVQATPGHDLGWRVIDHLPGVPTTDFGKDICPEGLFELLCRLRDDYDNVGIYITENGAAFDDRPQADGTVDDAGRVAFLQDHLRSLLRARDAGVDLRGYFVWSLLDNFEWAEGYRQRYGLFYVDYESQRRIPKASAHFYRGFVARHSRAPGAQSSP